MKLKDCPFCGAMAHVYFITYPNGTSAYCINCWHRDNCYLEGASEADFETEEAAVEAWNRRVEE